MSDLDKALATIEEETASIDTAAETLGVAVVTVSSMLARGQLQGVRVGRTVRIPNEELKRLAIARKKNVSPVA